MQFCSQCVQSDTRPYIYFENGVCGACLWEDEKKNINWQERELELQHIAQEAKQKKCAYDCAIGVSGGKDSTFQALYSRDTLGLKSLLVCSEPFANTPEGMANLENLKSLGFDVITLRANAHLLRKFFRKDFFASLNPNRASEYCLHASTYIIADKFDIPLIINGENAGQTLGISTLKKAGGDASNIWKHNTVSDSIEKLYVDDAVRYEELYLYHAT